MAAGALTLALVFASAVKASPATERFAQEQIDKGYVILNNTALSDTDRRRQFKEFMLALTDLRRIATFTLGQYANSASPAEIDAFVDAFSGYAVAVYETRLSQYRGQTLRVTGSQDRAADDSVVNMVVVNPRTPNATGTRAAFRIRSGPGGRLIITDMQVEGVWLAINQRADFTAFLQQNGGRLPTLTEHLRGQTRQLWGDAA
jgi:phospholipid transport system substrate-binding protein